jgi:hypothetical protein
LYSTLLICASQTQTFDAERQAFYDNEQHLKSRIQSLTQARKSYYARRSSAAEASEADPNEEEEGEDHASVHDKDGQSSMDEEDLESPETTALKLELSTLSTSHASLQSTLALLQTQLSELQRVNKELQVRLECGLPKHPSDPLISRKRMRAIIFFW